ncbi:MAG: succinate dehydrogenase cytochrome b subunit [Puniceicoccaceae bacterium]
MNPLTAVFTSSIGKKFLMALTGLVLAGFVLGHMLGNLQIFGPPKAINGYAYFLHQVLPWEVLYAIRFFLLGAVGIHIAMAVLLVIENRRARPQTYDRQKLHESTFAARTMKYTGTVLLIFIVFHILHFTIQSIDPAYSNFRYQLGLERETQDVYAMMIYGFSNPLFSVFYIIATGLLCWHLAHGFSSMFQTLGLRNEVWRKRLNVAALAYGWIVFLGFAIIPASVLASWYGGANIVDARPIKEAVADWDGQTPIYITYFNDEH